MSATPRSSITRHPLFGDALFALQAACAIAFGVAQARLMLTGSTTGVSVTWLFFWVVFLLINLSLAWQAHRQQPSRVTIQTVVVYLTWTALLCLNIVVFLACDALVWSRVDTVTALIAAAGISATLALGARRGLGVRDPMVRGWFAVFFKGVPQLTLAWNIWLVGGAGISVVGVVAGHITICSRLGQLALALREAGWDRNRRGAAIGELANELSWIVATIAWIMTTV